jgi:Na+-transporting NADH:ubiquinone oxidoreductase subunit NqrC
MSNTSKNRALVLIIVLLLLTNVALLAYFLWLKPPDKPAAIDKNRDRLAEALKNDVGFNDSQLAEYKKIKDAQWDKMKSRFDDLRKTKDNFFHLLSMENTNDSILNSAADSIAYRQKALDLGAFAHFKEVRKLCTPDQQPKYDSLVQRMFRRMAGTFMRANADSLKKN